VGQSWEETADMGMESLTFNTILHVEVIVILALCGPTYQQAKPTHQTNLHGEFALLLGSQVIVATKHSYSHDFVDKIQDGKYCAMIRSCFLQQMATRDEPKFAHNSSVMLPWPLGYIASERALGLVSL
jgi:hypothetical protein